MKLLKKVAVAAAGIAAACGVANAHTVAFGVKAGANPGEIEVWVGSYHTNGGSLAGIPFEGAAQLTGVNGTVYSQQSNFDMKSLTLPTGFVWGDNFIKDPSYSSPESGVVSFMGVTFAGLQPGDYQFDWVNQNVSAFWTQWSNDFLTDTFVLEQGDIGAPVPVPAALPLFAAGLAGLGIARRKKKAA